MSICGIPVIDTRASLTEEEAVSTAGEIGFPVVLKLHSKIVTHKSDIGGVQLDLRDAESVRTAFRSIRSSALQRMDPGRFLGEAVDNPATEAKEGAEIDDLLISNKALFTRAK